MRLGQLARKYGVSKKEIISYLKEKDPSLHSLGHNTKLDEQTVALLADQFEDPEVWLGSHSQSQAPSFAEASDGEAQDQVQEQDQSQFQDQAPSSESDSDVEQTPQEKKDGEAIETDKLLELLESEEDNPVDLSKITLIKAPKRELEGLKVVGKIELPEPKKKQKESTEEAATDRKPGKNRAHQRDRQLSEEEREKRRLRTKKKKEAYQARQEKRRKEKEKEQQKALNKARYQQKLARIKAKQAKYKPKPTDSIPPVDLPEPPAPPKTLLGKFWRWLNTA